MAYRNKTYVCFDGDSDMGAYRMMQAWVANDHIEFNFYNAHDLNFSNDTSKTDSIKAQLRERMANSKQMLVLVGEKTKLLRKFVPWEIELARKQDIPIICVNLNGKRSFDAERCPNSITVDDVYTLHVSFKAKIIQYALDEFPNAYHKRKHERSGQYYYKDSIYTGLDL